MSVGMVLASVKRSRHFYLGGIDVIQYNLGSHLCLAKTNVLISLHLINFDCGSSDCVSRVVDGLLSLILVLRDKEV